MFNFFKKKTATKEVAKEVKEVQEAKEVVKKAVKGEKHILAVMEKTGWDYAKAHKAMKQAKKDFGIKYAHYNRYEFYNIPVEEQAQKYEEVLAKIERRKLHKEKKQEKAIAGIMEKTGWDHDYTEAKILEAQERTGCTYKEYLIYKFYELDAAEQEEVFVAHESRKITAKYDVNKEFVDMLYNKEATNEYFSEFLNRPWCVNTKISLEDFTEKFAESKRIIYKPLDGNRGRGVEAYDICRENAKEIYDELVTFPAGVVEQYVVQHPEMSTMSPTSVNTLRIVTISSNTQEVVEGKHLDIAYAALRMGGGKSIVDNFHSGGMVAAIDLETGKLVTDAADMEGNVFAEHPATGRTIKGFEIPHFKEALKLVTDAIEKNKVEGYLGWDVAITEDGPVLIEVNVIPGVVLLSMPYVAERKGMRYVMAKYL